MPINRGSLSYLLIFLSSCFWKGVTHPVQVATIYLQAGWNDMTTTHRAESYGHGMGCNMPPIFADLWQACFALMYKWGHDRGAPLQISNVNAMHSLSIYIYVLCFAKKNCFLFREWMARMDGEKSCTRQAMQLSGTNYYRYWRCCSFCNSFFMSGVDLEESFTF